MNFLELVTLIYSNFKNILVIE